MIHSPRASVNVSMNSPTKKLLRAGRAGALVAFAAAFASPALAADVPALAPPAPEGVLSLTGSATVQVPNDWISVDFTVTQDGPDAALVQAGLKSALAGALEQAQRVARPDGHVEVQGGGFSLQPHLDPKGRVSGWNGTTQLRVQGRDMATIAALAGQVSTMSVASLGYGVSREAREKVEGDVAAQAIARFRAKAADYAKAFGYAGYVVRDVNVQTEDGNPAPPRPMMMSRMSAVASAPLPIEAGSGTVTSTVSGSVQLR